MAHRSRLRWFVLGAGLAAACAPATSPAPVAPAPASSAPAPSSTAAATTATSTPAPRRPRPLSAEDEQVLAMRIAADSAADAVVLDQLATMTGPTVEDEESPGAVGRGTSRGGPKAVATYDLNVEPYASHQRVQYWLDFFQGPVRERMGIWLQRMPKYEPMIRQRLQQEGLPGDLTYLALIESGFSVHAVSRAKAVGMWQFMAPTARLYGLRVDYWVDERRDPRKATDAAARHLADLYRMFGSYYLAAAAYNAGAGRVSRGLVKMDGKGSDDEEAALDETPDDTYFRLADTRYLHRETKDYVPKLIAAAMIAKDPERYGFTPAAPDSLAADPFAWDSIEVAGGTRLAAVARYASVSPTDIKEMNPHFIRAVTPPGRTSWVRVPLGTAADAAAAYAAAPPPRVEVKYHVVKKGETAARIARRYGVTVATLQEANPGAVRKGKVKRGQKLMIPVLVDPVDRAPVTLASAGTPAAGPERPSASRSATNRPASSRVHVVRRGETLSGIGARYGVSVASIKRTNGLSGSAIRSGQRLRIPAS